MTNTPLFFHDLSLPTVPIKTVLNFFVAITKRIYREIKLNRFSAADIPSFV